MEARIHKLWPSWVLLGGLVAVFAGERIFAAAAIMRLTFAALGGALVLTAVAVRALEWAASDEVAGPDRKPVRATLLACTVGVAAGVALYALIPLALTGDDSASERVRGVVWALWPIAMALSGLPLLFIEVAVTPVAYIDRYERAQVRRATIRGVSLALFLSVLFVGNYLAKRHEVKLALATGTSASVTDQTRRIVRDLTKDVQVVLFFPRANDVSERLERYFEPLERLNAKLEVSRVDHALASELAKEAEVTENGYVALYHGKNHEKIRVGTQNRAARSALRRFDDDFVKALIRVTIPEKVAYFYAGHAERAVKIPRGDDQRAPMRKLRTQLEQWRYKVKPFSVAQGSASELPEDADVLFIMGPEKPFLDEEIAVLKRALTRGIRLFVALEAERSGDPLDGLLAALGLRFDKTPLVAPRSNLRLTRTAADKSYIFSNRFSTHASVTTMTRNPDKLAAIFYKVGVLTKQKGAVAGAKTDIVLTSLPDTFADANDNLRQDAGEAAKAYGLAAAVTVTSTSSNKQDESRVFVLADADAMADELFRVENAYFLLDIVRWLQKDPEVFVPTSSENDVKIVHKGTEDALVFYGTTLAVPVVILVAGALATRRRRRS